jgi:photosystem II stability/assembly factor-like uncharacterized protein
MFYLKFKKMKRLFVFVPATFLLLFLLYSFVLKDKEAVLKSTDGGQTWKDSSDGLPEMGKPVNIVEAEGVLVATGTKGIRRSTDHGEHWQWVISEGGLGIAVERIEGGFAAITYSSRTNTRRVRISLDSGKTWEAIDGGGLRPALDISSIKQMGKYLICGHPDGIFRSSDSGKTWESVHPAVEEADNNLLKFIPWISPSTAPGKVFRIYVSGNVVYAVAASGGC